MSTAIDNFTTQLHDNLVTGTTEDVTQAKQMLDKISHGMSMSVAA